MLYRLFSILMLIVAARPAETEITVAHPTAIQQPTLNATPTQTSMSVSTPTQQHNRPPSADKILYDFTSRTTTGQWYIVNDGVMGGVSQSSATLAEPNILIFTGTVSLDNSGGFASLRSEPTSFEMADMTAVRLRVLGDGQRYHLRFHTDNRIDGVVYDQEFETSDGEWLEITLPIERFLPQYRGRVLSDQPALDPADITSLTFMIKDKQVGEFSLQVDWISAVVGQFSAENRNQISEESTDG